MDEKDVELVEGLGRLKVPKRVSVLIAYLAAKKEVTAREIEMGTGLRQPEVSTGMCVLREKKWVTERDVRAEKRGRLRKVYSLSVSLEEIIKYYEEKKSRESAKAMQAIQRLREIAAT